MKMIWSIWDSMMIVVTLHFHLYMNHFYFFHLFKIVAFLIKLFVKYFKCGMELFIRVQNKLEWLNEC
jgi:hypothetical protein